MEKKSKFKSTK